MKRKLWVIVLAIATILLMRSYMTNQPHFTQFKGKTMGTTFTIKAQVKSTKHRNEVESAITERLGAINQSMSTYISDSEISQFNRLKASSIQAVSDDFRECLMVAQQLYTQTNAAFDPSMKPLLNLWGFGNTDNAYRVPSKEDILKTLQRIGFKNLEISDAGINKKLSTLEIDLSAIAKGYAVDAIAKLLESEAIPHYFIEIGGEIRVGGLNPNEKPWRIGIQNPTQENSDVQQSKALRNQAMATSGDYRQFFEKDSKRYTHVIDPRNGYPVDHKIASVTVIAPTCALADGLATALMVMGPKRGIDLVNRLDQVEAMLLIREKSQFKAMSSQNWVEK